MSDEIRYLGDLQRLDIKPEDILVLSVDEALSQEMVARLTLLVEQAIAPSTNRVLILSKGMKLGVLDAATPSIFPHFAVDVPMPASVKPPRRA